ncbi:type 1 glutamine amidotransferase domain-containing protein [Paraburkholderia tropica]|uniref:type 1 glutamine amidotransferase domain-containing protein n=1 Tax=Paraburkholderia tropica TaxID=92647 RepID=UPI002AB00CF8|nr:type 1 glutamine amidotransferase domain-containing protein [Paraburkholderia tropica]
MNTSRAPRVLMIATHGYEESELFDTQAGLEKMGAVVSLASTDKSPIKGVVWDDEAGESIPSTRMATPDQAFKEVDVDTFDALVLPGGVTNPDILRCVPAAVDLVRKFVQQGKPVAAICHAPWLLVEADVLGNRRVTGWYSIRRDLANAGATVVDEAVVVDGNLITSRMPSDIPTFVDAIGAALR